MRVLFVGYENESLALAKLAQRLEADSHETKLVLGDKYNFINDSEIRRRLTEEGCEDWVSLEAQYEKLYTTSWDVDWDYLASFERRFCHNKTLQELVKTDHILTRDHHFRRPFFYPDDPDPSLVYYWVELAARWLESEISAFDPDVVFTLDRNYLVKNAAAQMAMATDRQLLTLIRSRVGDYHHLSRNFGYGTERRIREHVTDDAVTDLTDAREWCERFRQSNEETSLYDATAQELTGQTELFTTSEVLGKYTNNLLQLIHTMRSRSKREYRGLLKGNYLDSNRVNAFKFRTRTTYNRLKYIHANPFEQNLPDRPFVYLPLHTLPESSTLTLSTEYYEDDLVRFVSTKLPAPLQLVVKENPNMVGLRPFDYYESLDKLSNVTLVDPAIPSKRLIDASRGVCGISGTALLEAAVLSKPTHCFGHPEFEVVVDHSGYDRFSDFVALCADSEGARNPEYVVRYFDFILRHGRSFSPDPLQYLNTTEEYYEALDTVEEMLREEFVKLTH